MGDGPAHVGPSHREGLLGRIGRLGGRGTQRLVKLDEALGGGGG
jgi:hypothetical protein